MIITANFTHYGIPQDGLSPIIRILQIPNTIEVSGDAMIELTGISGAYYYDFTNYDSTGNYIIKCDAGTDITDRYTWAGNADDLEIGTGITKIINDLDDPDQYKADVTGIDNLSGYIAPLQVDLDNPAQYMANVTGINDLSGYIAPLQVNLDDPNQYKADITGINDLSGYIATIDINVDSVKTKTDNLPDDTSGQMSIVMGLLHKNLYTTTYWDEDDMTGAQIRIYDSAFNAGVHSASGVLLTLGLTGTFAGGKTQTILVVEE